MCCLIHYAFLLSSFVYCMEYSSLVHISYCEHAACLPLLLLLVHGATMLLQLQRALGRVPTHTIDHRMQDIAL